MKKLYYILLFITFFNYSCQKENVEPQMAMAMDMEEEEPIVVLGQWNLYKYRTLDQAAENQEPTTNQFSTTYDFTADSVVSYTDLGDGRMDRFARKAKYYSNNQVMIYDHPDSTQNIMYKVVKDSAGIVFNRPTNVGTLYFKK